MTEEKKVELTPDMIEIDKDGNVKLKGLNAEDIKDLESSIREDTENFVTRPVFVIQKIIR